MEGIKQMLRVLEEPDKLPDVRALPHPLRSTASTVGSHAAPPCWCPSSTFQQDGAAAQKRNAVTAATLRSSCGAQSMGPALE